MKAILEYPTISQRKRINSYLFSRDFMNEAHPKTNEVTEFFGEVISKYTSDQAEEDGILVKTDNPIINHVTRTVWDKCIEPFIEASAMTKLSLSNKPMSEVIEVGKKSFIVNIKITEEQKKSAAKQLLKKLLDTAIIQIKAQNREDWLYTLKDCRGWELWVAQNETGKFTLMFPEDY